MEVNVLDRFLKYVAVDTESEPGKEQVPSTQKQKNLAAMLVEEMNAMGFSNVRTDEHAYVYGTIPANCDSRKEISLGFVAHMDTAPGCSGKNVKPIITGNYDGSRIIMNQETGFYMDPAEYPELLNYVGQDLITTDGSTLLGADDKAGIAEIMAMAEYLFKHPEIRHGDIHIGYTPDEEIGRGADFFDVKEFGANVAYTVDGGPVGELQCETFNAASAKLVIHGFSIHTGLAKGKMKNALLMAMDFQSLLPPLDDPAHTEGYEGFFHLERMSGNVEEAELHYIIRDHDMKKFQERKEYIQKAAACINQKYGEGTAELEIKDTYYNMKEKMKDHMYLMDMACDALRELGIEPVVQPIRGGTDGARLSYMGLPCPNLCTGGHNCHGRYEFISVQAMETVTRMLLGIVKRFEEAS